MRTLLTTLIIVFFFLEGVGQTPSYRFDNISSSEGLSEAEVMGIDQDDKGYIWIGTQDGLKMFDGYNYKIFKKIPGDSSSISTSAMWSILADTSGVWIGTGTGLCRYDAKLGKFSDNFEINRLFKKEKIKIVSFGTMIYDNSGNLWLSAVTPQSTYINVAAGLGATSIFIMNVKNGLIKKMEGINVNTWSSCKDSKGNLWFGADGMGAFSINPENRSIIKTIDLNKLTGINTFIADIKEDKKGNIWFATRAGLVRYSPQQSDSLKLFKHDPFNYRSILSNNVNAIAISKKGELWVGSDGGISIYNPDSDDFTNLQSDPDDRTSLSENRVTRLFFDRSDNLWIGHYTTGVDKLMNNKGFKVFRVLANKENSLLGNNITAICEDKNNGLWVSSKGGGLNYMIRNGNHYSVTRSIKANKEKGWLTNPEINVMAPGEDGHYWIGTPNELFDFDPSKNTFERNYVNISEVTIQSIAAVANDKVFIGTIGDGLLQFNKNTKTFTRKIPNKDHPSTSTSTSFFSIIRDKENGIFPLSFWGTAFQYSHKTDNFFPFHIIYNKKDIKLDSSMTFTSGCIDRDNNYWISTSNGLIKFKKHDLGDSSYLEFKYILDERNGLASNIINSMQVDKSGNLWLGHMAGLSKLNVNDNSFVNYDVTDGLPGNAFNLNATRLSSGELAFGNTRGLVIFHPDSLSTNTNIPNISFTDIKISNQSVGVKNSPTDKDISDNGQFLLNNSIEYTKEIILPYDVKIISFEFAALEYTSLGTNTYKYKLEGFEDKWVNAGVSHAATYTNLNPGHYTFRVIAANNDGVWNEEGISMVLVVLPPPWLTWWAYSLYSIFGIALLIFAWQQVIRRERLKNEVKLKQLEAEKYQEIDGVKSRFFANISHEFRTPLTLILGPLEKYLKAPGNSPGKQTELTSMYQNAVRLLNLVNQLLDLSRFEAGSMKLQVTSVELIQFITTIMSEFQSIADSKSIRFKLMNNEHTIPLYVDRDKLGKILNNLFANAFKFTPESGDITVSIKQEKSQQGFEDGFVKIQIKDSGIGIPVEHLNKIFDRFYQVDNSVTRAYEGSGIGLALTKELVQLCHGTISVESEMGKGSVFTVCLPLGSSFMGKDKIVDQATDPIQEWKPEVTDKEEMEVENELTSNHSTTVLVIEDNADLRTYLKNELSNSYHVIEAADGNQGIELAIQEIPAIIVSDLMMPGKNGMKICELLKEDERTSHIPIILLTAKAEMESKLQGYRIGADDYMAKPFQMTELQTRIDNLIANRKRLRAKYAQVIQLRPSELKTESVEDRFLKKVMNMVEAHIADPSFGLEEFATSVGMSKIQLYRKLKALTKHTPNEFIRDIRLQRAHELLKNRTGNVAEVAYQVGFKNLSYFSKSFKEKFGKTPSELL